MKKEYQSLVGGQRPVALEELKEARGMGSLEDNLQYEIAKEKLEIIDARIVEIEELLRQGNVQKVRKHGTVDVGSQVTVEIEGGSEVFVIVNPYEIDPLTGKISYESPVGKALMKRKPGDKVMVTLPHNTLEFVIVKVD